MNDISNNGGNLLRASDLFEILSRNWMLILAVALLGAFVGLVFSWLRVPVYEAEATLGINIIYGVTEHLELVVEDRALNRVSSLIVSDSVLEDTLDLLPQFLKDERQWWGASEFRSALRLDRRLAESGLVVKDADPVVAADVAETWAEVSLLHLDEAVQHAWRAAMLIEERFDVGCILDSSGDELHPLWQCLVTPLDLAPEVSVDQLQNELELTRGILPNISYELLRSPAIPQKPAIWGRGVYTISGGLLGLVLGLGIASVFQRVHHKTAIPGDGSKREPGKNDPV